MNVVRLFAEQARARPHEEALAEGRSRTRRSITFSELDEAGARAAGRLLADGFRPGDVALLLVPLSIRLYVLVAGILRAGGVVMLVDPGAGRDHLAACLERRLPDVFLGTPRAHLLRLVSREVRQIPRQYAVGGWVPMTRRWEGGEGATVETIGDDAPALLTFTSGSTGRPKAIVRTHGFLAAQHRALERALGLRPGQRDLSTLPVFVLANLASGVTSILPDADLRSVGSIDPGPVLAQIRAERPTRAAASPAFYERLLVQATSDDLASLDRLDAGGAPVFPDLLVRLRRAAPQAQVSAVYGSSEAEPISHLLASDVTDPDRERVARGGGLPAGHPVEEVDLRVVPDRWGTPLGPLDEAAWEASPLPPGEPGEIVVAGAHVLPGYLGGEGDRETKVRVGERVWHRTGDAGLLDEEGRLWLLGRCSAAVRDEMGTLYPLQVEAAARQIRGVRLAALVPGRRLVAYEGEAEHEEVTRALPWADVEAVRVDRIPLDRRHNAKVDYPALESLLAP